MAWCRRRSACSAVGGYWTGVFINVLLMWGPSMFVAPKTYQSFQYLSWLGLALLWPMLSGWLLPGLVLYRARRLRYPHTVAFVTAMYLLLAASRYPGAFGAGRVQLPVVPFMVAWVFETIVVARELRPASRRLLGAAVALHYTAMMLAHCGLALKRFG